MNCVRIPDEQQAEIVIEAQLVGYKRDYPAHVIARLAPAKGPVAFETHFEKGSIVVELLSFGALSTGEIAAAGMDV
jgi:hypothetical protein